MDLSYLICPFFTWLLTGSIKFAVNCIKERKLAFDLIGYGGMPSNHSAIVTAVTVLIALKEGISSPAFGGAITFAFIVMLDANSLRKQVGRHASAINVLLLQSSEQNRLRERIGHTRLEILAGCIVGILSALAISNYESLVIKGWL